MAKFFVCGDVVNCQNKDGLVCAPNFEVVVKSADYSICNFEAAIAGFGTRQPKSGSHIAQPASTVDGLKEQGFDLLLLANNHIFDYGKKGLVATLDAANKAGVDTLGAGVDQDSAYAPLIKEIDDIKIGIVNACEAQFGVIDHFDREEKAGYAWINHPKIDTTVLALKKECDFVIVCAHAGLENYDIPQKEWRIRYKHLCDLGADVIIGSHPHVPQGYEEHNESIIFYSLGNFYFDYSYTKDYKNASYSVMFDFQKNERLHFEIIHHITKNRKVTISEADEEVDLSFLCGLLEDEFSKKHDEMVLKAFEGVGGNLARAFSPIPSTGKTFKATGKEILATILGRRRAVNKDLLALHLLRNESYYFVARHALELKARGKNHYK